MKKREALGIDIGGVIISGTREDSFTGGDYLQSPEIAGAQDAIGRLVRERFGEKVFLISKRGPRVQAKTNRWLKEHQFFQRTGLKPRHLYFCLERAEKADLCTQLGITHFIDNRIDVLAYLRNVPHLFLFKSDPSASTFQEERWEKRIRTVSSWGDILRILLVKD